MKPKFVTPSSSLAAFFLTLAFSGLAPAAIFTYDADTLTTGAQDGTGTGWNTSASNLWDGGGNVTWPNSAIDEVIFGAGSGAAGTVTVGTVTTNRITFSTTGSGTYTLSSGSITLAGTTPTITANANAAIGSVLTGSVGLIKEGSSKLTLTGINNYTGGTTINGGILQIGGTASNPTLGSGAYNITGANTLRIEYATTTTAATSLGNLTWANFTGSGVLNIAANGVFDYIANDAALPAGFTGTLKIDGGRVQTPASGGLGGTTKVIVNPGGHLGMWNNATTFEAGVSFEIAGTGYGEGGFEAAIRMAVGGATSTINGPVTLTGNATVGAAGTGVFNGSISGGFNFTTGTSSMTGTVQLGAANTHTGLTTVGNGTLRLAHQNALQNSTLSGNSGAVTFNTGVTDFTLGGLEGNRNLSLQNTGSVAVALTIGNNNANTTYGGTLSGSGSLVKIGSGASRLTGTTSYAGTTTVSGGTLQVPTGAATTGACTMADGTTLIVAGSSTQSWRTSSLTAGAATGATLEFPPMTASTAVPILATTALTTNGTVTVKTAAPYAVGVFPLIEFPAGTIGGAGYAAFALAALPPGVSGTLVDDSANGKVSLNITAVDQFVWQGTPGTTWDTGTTTAWTLSGSPTTFLAGGMALFDDSAAGATTVSVSGSVTPYAIAVNNPTKNYTFSGSGSITGTTGLVKSGGGTLTVANANTYTGTTTVNAGVLQIGDGTVDGSLAGPITNNATLTFNATGAPSYGGVLGGGGVGTLINKDGAGTLTLTGNNSFSGVTSVNAGTLRLGNGVTNATLATGTYTVSSGGRLLIDNATAVPIATLAPKMSGAGLMELNSAQAVNASANWGAGTFGAGFTGTLQVDRGRTDITPAGIGGMTKIVIKDGAQFLGWAGTYPADLAIDIAGHGWGEGGYPGGFRLAAGNTATWEGPVTLTANSTVMAQRTAALTVAGPITGNYQCTFYAGDPAGDSGLVTIAPANPAQNSYSSTKIDGRPNGSIVAGNPYAFSTGGLEVASAILRLNGNSFTFANLSGTGGMIGNYHATDPSILTVGGDDSSTTFGGSIVNGGAGTLSLTKAGTGALQLTGSATYTGNTTVTGGLLQIPAGTVTRGICTVADAAELAVTGAPGSLWKNNELILDDGSALTIRNFHSNPDTPPVEALTTMTTAGTVTVNVAGTFTTGVFPLIWYPTTDSIGGAGYAALTLGTLPRGVVATLQDDSTNSAVNLDVSAVNPVKWKGNNGSVWDIDTTANWTLAGSPGVYIEGDILLFDDTASTFSVTPAANVAPGKVTFDHTANDYTLSGATGVITGTSSLTKSGGGTLTITGAHTYTGGTTVSGGTLRLGDGTTLGTLAGSITNNANVTFNHSLPQTLPAGITGTGSLTKTGAGTLTVSAGQAYTGGTIVNDGIVKLFGTNNGNSSAGPGTLTVNTGATAEANSHNVLGNGTGASLSPLVIDGGTFLADQYIHINSITMTAGTIGARSGITQVDGMDMQIRNSVAPTLTTLASATSAVVSSRVNLRATTTITVADGAAASDLIMSGVLAGAGTLIKEGPGTLILTGPLAGSPAVPTSNSTASGNITLNGGKLVGAAVRTGTNTVFGSASNTRTITANEGTTLEFQAANTFGGHNTISVPALIVNNATVTNSDPLATNRINNALRNVTLNNGVLTATVGNGASSIDETNRPGEGYGCWGLNGTVTSSGVSTISSTATGKAANILLGSHDADTIMDVLDGTLTVSAPLQTGEAGILGGLQKTGAGTLVLSAANIYSTPTTVTDGTLELTGSLKAASGVTGPSNITVASGATLMGTGEADGTLAANGIVAPGSSIGTLATGTATFGATGSLSIEINSSTLTADTLAISGDLNIDAAATLAVSDLGSGTPPTGKLVIVTYTGTWNGVPFAGNPDDSTLTVNGNLYTINYNDTHLGKNAVTLNLGAVADPFVAWASGYGLTGEDDDKTADPDKDGISNLLEFATNSDPTSGSSGPRVYPLMFTIGADEALTYTVAVRKNAVFAASGSKQTATKDLLVYTVEASDDLATWTTVPVTEVTGATATNIQTALGTKLTTPALGADWEWHTFRTDAGAETDPSDYIRLQVNEAP